MLLETTMQVCSGAIAGAASMHKTVSLLTA